jgi:HlyD family secretion protein
MKAKLKALWQKLPRPVQAALPALLLLLLAWNLWRLAFPPAPVWIGYMEGEYLYVTSPVAGYLSDLAVHRGDEVAQNAPLFQLEGDPDLQTRDQAQARLAQARADLLLAGQNYERAEKLVESGAMSRQELDQRSRDLHASKESVESARRALSESQWRLDRKTQAAPQAGLVHDTYYVKGDWVEAGKPVLSLLPPGEIKARFFVPEMELARLQRGRQVRLRADGLKREVLGTINYIADRAEYTPPVIYSTESRQKLVFLVEASFAPEDVSKLHPGLPVSISPVDDSSP